MLQRIRLNVGLRGFKANTVLKLEADADGKLLDPYWGRRQKDSELDGCIEVVPNEKRERRPKRETRSTESKGEGTL